MKKSELKRKTPIKRAPFKRTVQREPRDRPAQRDGVKFSEKVKRKARLRAGNRCEVGGPNCTGEIEQYHHRRMRSQGGLGTLSNCLCVCATDHTLIHQKPDWAYRHGLLVRSWLEPHEVPVHAHCGPGCQTSHLSQ